MSKYPATETKNKSGDGVKSTHSNCIARFSQAMPYHVWENPNWSSRNIICRKSRVKEEIWLRGINRSSWCEYDWYVSVRYSFRSVANRACRSILYNARLSPWLKREKWKNVLLHVLTHQSRAWMRLSLCFQLLNCQLTLVSRFRCGFCDAFLFLEGCHCTRISQK